MAERQADLENVIRQGQRGAQRVSRIRCPRDNAGGTATWALYIARGLKRNPGESAIRSGPA
eukprot:13653756-Alexandrium_andersonii.AAC.1